jgi:hypothetical protein
VSSLGPILDRLQEYPEVNDVIIVTGDTPFNRYEAMRRAKNEMVYTQDDDCVTDLRPLIAAWCQRLCLCIVNAMTPEHAAQYSGNQTLIGFGALFLRASRVHRVRTASGSGTRCSLAGVRPYLRDGESALHGVSADRDTAACARGETGCGNSRSRGDEDGDERADLGENGDTRVKVEIESWASLSDAGSTIVRADEPFVRSVSNTRGDSLRQWHRTSLESSRRSQRIG